MERELLPQAGAGPVFRLLGGAGFPQGTPEHLPLPVGRGLHHPVAGFGVHKADLELHRRFGSGMALPRVDPLQGVMEAESIESLTPLLQEVDRWHEILLVLPLLVVLEAVLSADNAVALAAISRRLHDRARQETALNLGLLLALVFRIGLILAARWVLDFWPLQLAAASYLLWLCGRHLASVVAAARQTRHRAEAEASGAGSVAPAPPAPAALTAGMASVVATLAVTDLAFSVDSVAAAVAVTDRLPLVIAGGVIGVVALRLTAELFIRWLEVFRHLEAAGYLAVGLVGLRLVLRLVSPQLELPEWALLSLVAALFAWGFSERESPADQPAPGTSPQSAAQPDPQPSRGPAPGPVPEPTTDASQLDPGPAARPGVEPVVEQAAPLS